MNLQNALTVIILSLVVLRPTLTLGVDPKEFIQKICSNCSQYEPKDPTLYPRLCTEFMSPFTAEIANDLGRAAIKSVELEISTINETLDYLKKFKPPPGTTAYMLQEIQMAINDLSSTAENHDTSVDDMKSLVPKPANMSKTEFEEKVLEVHSDMLLDIDYMEDCIESFDPPESPVKADIIARLKGVIARAIVAKCMIYPYSQL